MSTEIPTPPPKGLGTALTDYVDSRSTSSGPPPLADLLQEASVRRRRRIVRVGLAAAAVVAVPLAATAMNGGGTPGSPGVGPTTSVQPARSAPAQAPSGSVSMAEPAGCLGNYSPEAAMANAGFAFDGTVEAVEPLAQSSTFPSGDLVAVRFRIASWYVGSGGADEVTVVLGTPEQTEDGEGYSAGTRMLVSGETVPSAKPAYVAWGCGFTRYFDESTASQWDENAD